MKTNLLKIGIFTFATAIAMTSLTSCGGSNADSDEADKPKEEQEQEPVSEKGNWTDADIERAMAEINSERDQMVALIGEEKTDAFIDCAMEKVEANYESFAAADADYSGMEKIGEECMMDLLQDMEDLDM